jgi:prophage endopeptidase
MIAAAVALLGGWRATAFAACAVLLAATVGYERMRVSSLERDRDGMLSAAATQRAEYLAQLANASEAARATEQRHADALAAADATYQREKQDAQAVAGTLAAGLLSGTIKLRRELAACGATTTRVPATAGDTGRADAAAELRTAVARSVAVGAGCDARVRALQAVLTGERVP